MNACVYHILFTTVFATGMVWSLSASAQQITLNGALVVGSPNVTAQIAIPDGETLAVEQGASVVVTGAAAVIDAADGTAVIVDNSGAIQSTDNAAIDALDSTLTLTNAGAIIGSITGINYGVRAGAITSLTNTGTISGGFGVNAGADISSLTNGGTIHGTGFGVRAVGNLGNLTNTGAISGGFFGVAAEAIGSLNNSGTIVAVDVAGSGVAANTTITSLVNSGTIIGQDGGGVGATDIVSLINSGTITSSNYGVATVGGTITSLTNSGTISGVNDAAIAEGLISGGGDTLLTLLPGSNIQGAIDLGPGVNTLNVGNGLNLATTFATLPDVIISNGAPMASQGTTVAVVDPTSLSVGSTMTVSLANSVSTALSSRPSGGQSTPLMVNGFWPVASISSTESYAGNTNVWLTAFGGTRQIDGSGPAVDADHHLGGFVLGADGRVQSGCLCRLFKQLCGHAI